MFIIRITRFLKILYEITISHIVWKKYNRRKKAKKAGAETSCLLSSLHRPSMYKACLRFSESLARVQTTVVAVHAPIRQRIFKGRTYGFAKLLRVTFHHVVVLFTVEVRPVRKYIVRLHTIYTNRRYPRYHSASRRKVYRHLQQTKQL